ncbi:MAG: hypothetical protein J0L55_13300 [Caulobacterales bacterium]|nr:hypothetical protein [Caulobacterales bacterium]
MKTIAILLSFIALISVNAHSQDISQNQINNEASSFTKEGKLNYEYYLWRFSDLLNELPYAGRQDDGIKNMLIICNSDKLNENNKGYPIWAKESFGEVCKFANAFNSIIIKNKKPLGKQHCIAINNAAIEFEKGINSTEWAETKQISDNFLYILKKTYKLKFTHSWSGGWFGTDSYEYSCQ